MKFTKALNLIMIFSLALAGVAGTVGSTRAQAATAAGFSNQTAAAEGPQLYLQGGSFDPLQGEPTNYPAALAGNLQPDTNGLRMLQFEGPIQDEWLASLEQSGLNLVAYLPDYGYLVWGNGEAVASLEKTSPVRWSGSYRPAYALSPLLATEAPGQTIDVLVQVYLHPEVDKTVAQISAAGTLLREPYDVLAFRNLGVRLPADQLSWLANLPGVVDVQPFPQPVKLDEIQDQIMAGNLSGSSPTGPGYLAWLQSKGFSTNPNDYPIVDVTDDGIDIGTTTPTHPDFYQFGSKSNASRVAYMANFSTDGSADGGAGHGNLNAAIVAGYNDKSGSANKDNSGYSYGLGVNPYGRVGGSKTFSNKGKWTYSGTSTALVSNQYARGARISSDSWGDPNSHGAYTADSQEYDALTRDAVPGQSGNQPMIFAFAAGNEGSGSATISSPGTAKNVITVGASENVRPTVNGSSFPYACYSSASFANSAFDVANFSSRGPTSDGRFKPEIMAPGTHIIAAASQSPNYNGSGVCAKYVPSGQTLYTASNGTSHSTPAVAGALSLLYRYYQLNYGGQPPSPAMARAYLTNSARWMSGNGAYDTLPSSNQGMGLIDLGMAFDGVKRQLVDQSTLLSSTGQTYSLTGLVADTSKPFRVTLAWTDAPGTPAAASYVNNLNLEVTIGGQTYLGNVFDATQKAVSTTGGTADAKNNLESVFLPAGVSGLFSVKVKAANIAGDGLPGNGDATDQDFALVIYNGTDATGTLQGRVTSAAGGAALNGVKIQAVGPITQTATTDTSGAYSLQKLDPGTYNLTVWKYGYVQQITSASVSAGGTVTQNFSLAVAPAYSLSGCATDAVTSQGLKADLVVRDAFGAQVAQTATTLLNNCYNLNLSQGVFTLRASSLLHQDKLATVTMTTNRTQNMALTATTTNGMIFGVVSEQAGGAPVVGASLAISPGGYSTVSSSDGSYSIQLAPGTYTVDVSAPLYSAAQATNVIVSQSNLAEQNFSLLAPKMSLAPTALVATLDSGGQANLNLAVSNLGAVGLDYVAYESDGRPPSGGPDTYGYLMLDSRNTGGVSYNWIDMTSATPVNLPDDSEVNVSLPFSFEYYGVTATSLRLGNNGGALFNATTGDVTATNYPLSSGPSYMIAPYWTDLGDTTGSVAYMTDGTAPNRRFVVAWQGLPHFASGSSGTVTFQMVLYEGSNNLKFQYQDASFGDSAHDNGASATVGIRGAGGQLLQASYNTAWLADGLAVCFQHPRSQPCDPQDIAWMSVTPMNGLLVTSTPQNTQVTVDAALTPGKGGAFAILRFLSNDPSAQPYRDVPVVVLMNPLWMPLVIRR